MGKRKYQGLIEAALCTALTVVGGFLRFPIPGLSVQFTMQPYFVVLSGLLLGARYGALSQVAYVVIGLMGVPVFTRGGGLQYVLQPEFGYLMGFVAAAATAGFLRERLARRGKWGIYVAGVCGVLALYLVALPYIGVLLHWVLANPIGIRKLVMAYGIAFMPLDLIKAVLAAGTGAILLRHLSRTKP